MLLRWRLYKPFTMVCCNFHYKVHARNIIVLSLLSKSSTKKTVVDKCHTKEGRIQGVKLKFNRNYRLAIYPMLLHNQPDII